MPTGEPEVILIVDNSNPQETTGFFFPSDDLFTATERRKGLPIGNLTSQFFANVYLDGFDHFIREKLRPGGYVRYCDDFALFADDKTLLWDSLAACREHLEGLRLLLHADKCQVFPAGQGAPFLGYRVLPGRRRLDPKNGWRMAGRIRAMQRNYAYSRVDLRAVRSSICAWIGHARHADTLGLRRRLLSGAAFVRGRLPKRLGPGVAGRVLEQQPQELPIGKPRQEQPGEQEREQRPPGRAGSCNALQCQNPAAASATAGACEERAQGDVLRCAGRKLGGAE